MRLLMLGINHRTADVRLRERLVLEGDRLEALFERFRSDYPFAELVVLSTCNRTELYVARATHEPPAAEDLRCLLAATCDVPADAITGATIHREQDQALGHLFRVAGGLESMVLGEAQILGQVKRAYDLANTARAVGPVMHRVFQQATATAKKVRQQTGIDSGRLSIGSVAVDFARQVFDSFADKTVVGLGAGEIGKLALSHLKAQQPAKLWVTSRTLERAADLARALDLDPARGGARAIEDLDELLVEADVLVTCAASADALLDAARFKPIARRRRNRPLFIIDLALPRNVNEDVAALTNVYLYNLDDLQQVVTKTAHERQAEAQRCLPVINDAVQACLRDIQHRDIGQLIRALRGRLLAMGEAETQRLCEKLDRAGDDEERKALLEQHTHRLINKILHLPLSKLDSRQPDAPLGFYAAALRRLFDLDQPPEPPEVPDGEAHADRAGADAGTEGGAYDGGPDASRDARSRHVNQA